MSKQRDRYETQIEAQRHQFQQQLADLNSQNAKQDVHIACAFLSDLIGIEQTNTV